MRLANKIALITGGGRGIGAGIARRMAQEGADVILVSRTMAELVKQEEWIRNNTSADVLVLEGDVSSPADVNRTVDAAIAKFGRIDILVNCAGVSLAHPSVDLPFEDWKRVLNINLDGTFLYCQAVGLSLIHI